MTAKEYLRQYEYAAKRVKRLEEEYNTEREQIDAVRSVSDNDGMPHGNGISKPTEDKAVRLADKLQELADARLDAVEIKREVFNFVEGIGGEEGEVLYCRYIKLLLWREVADELGYTERAVFNIHARALAIVDRLLS